MRFNKNFELAVENPQMDEICNASASKIATFSYAVSSGNIEILRLMMEHGVNIHARKNQAMRMAAAGNMEVLKFLVEHGTDIHACDDEAVRRAAEGENLEVVRYLVEQGANVHAINPTILFGKFLNDIESIQWLESCGIDIAEWLDEILIDAAQKNHSDVVKYMIERGADIHTMDDETLKFYIGRHNPAMTWYLAEHGADIRRYAKFALYSAFFEGSVEMIKCLEKYCPEEIIAFDADSVYYTNKIPYDYVKKFLAENGKAIR